MNEIMMFDYAGLDIPTQEFLKSKEIAIKSRSAQTIIDNGRDLLEVKERLEHGQFQKWIAVNFPWSYKTATRFINAYENFKSEDSSLIESFQREALFLLAAPSAPEPARQEAIELAEGGEKITHEKAKELVEAHKRIAEQTNRITNLEQQIKTLQSQLPTEDVKTQIQMLKDLLAVERNKKPQTIEIEKIKEKIPEDYIDLKILNQKHEKELSKLKAKIIREKAEHEKAMNVLIESKELPKNRYGVIYADPPWKYEFSKTDSRKIENQYPTMELDDIKSIPVYSLADKNSLLFLWATSPKLAEAISVLESWGFHYVSSAIWDKKKKGMGYYFRQKHEILLIGRRGSPGTPNPEDRIDSIIEHERLSHSEKPEIFYEIIEKMFPVLNKIELFARRKRQGWDAWGSEF